MNPALERKLGRKEMLVQKLESSPISCTRKSQTNLFRKFNLLNLFVDGNLEPLLGCNAFVDSSL